MNDENIASSDPSVTRATNADAEIESLARDTEMPIELVQRIYASERAKLEQTARIKTYVLVLVHRQVKALLLEQRAFL
jgi:Protein of unknown function (DUF3562)